MRIHLALTRLLLLIALTCSAQAYAQVPLNLAPGWNLLGNSSAAPIDVAGTFNDSNKFLTVWKWNKTTSVWAFYAPSMASADLATYTQGKGYDVLTSIAPKEGFWVNALTAAALTGPVANGVTLVESDLPVGWNLMGSADAMTPSQLNQSLASGLNAGGKLIVTAWAWKNVDSRWKFYAPTLEAQGGTVLADYVSSKGYVAFTSPLTNAEGFWLNIAAGTPTVPDAPTGVAATAGVAQATVTFAAPANSGFSAITGYTVTSSPAGGVDSNAGTTGLSHVVTGLVNGIAYTFTVTATNSVGTGAASAASSSVTPATPSTVPGAPTGVTATAGNAQGTVTFAAPSSDGGSAITGYTVTSSPAGGTDSNAGTTGLSHVITGLINGTAYTFTVKATNSVGTGAASAASSSVTPSLAPLACSDLSTPLALSMAASRNLGVAPLSVFFDATGTTSNTTVEPFHEVEYRWNFGDNDALLWSYGAHVGDGSALAKKNRATGPIAAHVFEAPGTYTVVAVAVDGSNTASCSVQVTVDDPAVVFAGNNTVCIGATSDPVPGSGGCPSGAAHFQQSSWPTIVSTYAKTGKRVLLKTDDIFTGPATAQLNTAGPGIIGAFGPGARPVIRTTATANYSSMLSLSGSISDWRLMDLDIDGQSNANKTAITFDSDSAPNKILLLRLSAHNLGGGLELGIGSSNPSVPDQIALVDSTIQTLTGSGSTSTTHGLLLSASRAVVMGNLIDNGFGAEQPIRIPYFDRAIMSNNQIQGASKGRELITLRAPCQNAPASGQCTSNNYFAAAGLTGVNAITRKVIIADNYIKQAAYVGIQVKAVNTTDLVGFKDIIIERNFVQSQVGNLENAEGISIFTGAVAVTVRNNLIDTTVSPAGHLAISTGPTDTTNAPPDKVWIYNNSHYDNATISGIVTVRIRPLGTNIVVKNNLAYAPSGTSPSLLSSDPVVTAGGNSTNSQVKSTVPGFTVPPTTATAWKPTSGYAIGGGVAVPVWSDFFLITQPATRDIGAMIH